jgi:hypothetical protein
VKESQHVMRMGVSHGSDREWTHRPLRIVCTLVCAWIILGSIPLRAQSPTGTLLGKVLDPSGRAIVGASVEALNAGTGLERNGKTNSTGDYLIPSLPVGSYVLTMTAQGFQQFTQSGITLEVGQHARVDANLKVGTTSQKIEVSAQALQVDTQTATVGTEVDNRQIQDLPLNTRDVLQLVTLIPGVANAKLPAIVTNQRSGPTLSVNGTRANASNIILDGTLLYTSLYNNGVNLPNPDSIGEFKLLTSNYDAQYGRAAGGVFVAVSKSGTNQFHGTAWEFLRNTAFDARNYFAPAPAPKPVLKQNQFGAAFGGPILKDKTFFYATYEGLRIHTTVLQNIETLTAAERLGDFSAVSKRLKNPSTGLPYLNNQIPSSEFDPMAVNYISDYVPVADPQTGQSISQIANPTVGNQFTIKGDHHLSANDLLSARFFRESNSAPNFVQGNYVSPTAPYTTISQGISMRETHTFGANLLADVGFAYTTLSTVGGNQKDGKTPQQLGGVYPQDGPVPETPSVTVSGGFTDTPLIPWNERSELVQYDGKVIWIKGHHEWSFGIMALRPTQQVVTQYQSSGAFTFSGAETGNALADLLIGRPINFTQKSVVGSAEHTIHSGIFAQDIYKVSNRLTLDLGLRYEVLEPWEERNDQNETVLFDSSFRSTRYPTAPPGMAYPGDPGIPNGGFYPRDKADFAPRLGFAYDLSGNGRTAIRGGYGIFYNTPPSITTANTAGGPPFKQILTFVPNSFSDPYGTTHANPFPFTFDPKNLMFVFPTAAFAPSPLLKDEFIQQYNLNVQHQFPANLVLQISYVGSRGNRLWDANEGNSAPYVPGATAANAQSRRPFENQYYAGIAVTTSDGYSSYNSLQVSAQKRFSNTYSMQLAYTYSKSLDTTSQGDTDHGNSQNPADPLAGEYGPSDFNQKHLFRVNGVWELPRLESWGVARQAIGGWELSGIFSYSSGLPFSVTTGSPANWLGSTGNMISNLRLNTIGKSCVGCGGHSQWTTSPNGAPGYFDPAAFVTPTYGQFGDSGRNSFVSPSYTDTDMSLIKNFALSKKEGPKIQFHADFFNIFNNVYFDAPKSTNSSSTFGKITKAEAARQIQFALRFEF